MQDIYDDEDVAIYWKNWAKEHFYYNKEAKQIIIKQNLDREYCIDNLANDLGITISWSTLFLTAEIEDISMLQITKIVKNIDVDLNNKIYSSWNGSLYSKDFSKLILYYPTTSTIKTKEIELQANVNTICRWAINGYNYSNNQNYILKKNNNLLTIEDYAIVAMENFKVELSPNLKNITANIVNWGKGILFNGENNFYFTQNNQLFSKSTNKQYIFEYNNQLTLQDAIFLSSQHVGTNIIEKISNLFDHCYYETLQNKEILNKFVNKKKSIMDDISRYKQQLEINPNDEFLQLYYRIAQDRYDDICCYYYPSPEDVKNFTTFINEKNGYIYTSDKVLIRYYGDNTEIILDDVHTIFKYAFNNNYYIKSINIQSPIKTIEMLAINCINLETIIIPKETLELGENFINGDSCLKTLQISKDSCLKILNKQKQLSSIKEIYIPKTTQIIKFPSSVDLENISPCTKFIIDSDNPIYSSYNGCVFDKRQNKFIYICVPNTHELIFEEKFCNYINANLLKPFLNIETIEFVSQNMFIVDGPLSKAGNKHITRLVFLGDHFDFNFDIFSKLGSLKQILFSSKNIASLIFEHEKMKKYRKKIFCLDETFENDNYVIYKNEKYYSLYKSIINK